MAADCCCRCCLAPTELLFSSGLAVAVSSSCVPRRASSRIYCCSRCGLVQKSDQELVADYEDYSLFDNDPAADKVIRQPGRADRTRSQFVADLLLAEFPFCRTGRILEVGCHRGALLRAVKERAPEAELFGFDINPDYGKWIDPICGRGRYFHGDLEALPGLFDA